jgi:hypothetical protein
MPGIERLIGPHLDGKAAFDVGYVIGCVLIRVPLAPQNPEQTYRNPLRPKRVVAGGWAVAEIENFAVMQQI